MVILMIKAIATDLDGTLFYPRKKVRLISNANKQFIQNVLKEGKEVILVTGRNYSIANKVEQAIGMTKSISIVACNGAVIMHQGEMLKEDYISGKEALELYYEIYDKHPDIKTWMFFTSEQFMIVEPSGLNPIEKVAGVFGLNLQGAYYEPYILGKKKMVEYLSREDTKVYKIMPWFGYRSHSKILARDATAEWIEKYGDKYNFAWAVDAVEISKKGIDKASALKQLLKELNINEDEVAVVGDSGNDVSLFKSFKNSFVMNQAAPEVKKEAKQVVNSVSDLANYIK